MAEPSEGDRGSRAVAPFAYRPALDGLRAIAVLFVLVYHNDLYPLHAHRLLRGGFLGVDIFFVISGYLITSLLLTEHDTRGRIGIPAFWGRRVRRLLPALCVMLLMVALYARVIAAPEDLARIRGDALATLFYVQNWHLILADRGGSILSHAWSLSVEEQWYLVWPAIVVALLAWRRSRQVRISAVVAGLALVSAVWTLAVAAHGSIGHAYLGTDTRAQELLVGAALALLMQERLFDETARRRVELLALVGTVVVVGLVAMSPAPGAALLTRGGYFVFALAVAAVVAAAVQPAGLVCSILSIAPLRAVGLISYGLYLYHWPLYWYLTPARAHASGAALFALRIAATFAIATASFLVIERPIRRGTRIATKPFVFAPVVVAVMLVTVLVATREPPVPPLISNETVASYAQIGTSAHGIRVLVVGEARAFQLQYVGGAYTRDDLTGASLGFLDCGLVAGDLQLSNAQLPEPRHCVQRLQAVRDVAVAFRPDVVVLMPEDQELFNRRVGSQTYEVGTRLWGDYVSDQLDLVRRAAGSSDHTPTLLLSVPCGHAPTAQAALEKILDNQSRRRALNELLRSYAAQHADTVALADPAARPCDGPAAETTALTRDSAAKLWDQLAQRARGVEAVS